MRINFYKQLKTVLAIMLFAFFTNSLYSQSMTGAYTVNSAGSGSTNFVTLKDAIDSLNTKGVGTGGVTFNIVAGFTETAPTGGFVLTATGTSANPIAFVKSGVGSNPLLTAYTGGTATPASDVADGIFKLVGSDYVTIDGIDLAENAANTANPATMEYGYGLFKSSATNGCQYVNIKNCTITLSRINNASGSSPMVEGSVGIVLMNSTAAANKTALTVTARSGTNSYNTIESNTIQNSNYGIVLIGFASTSPFTNADTLNTIGGSSANKGNTIVNYGGATAASNPAAAIRTLAQYGLNISYNTINNNNGAGANHVSTLRGIYLNTATSANATVNNNTVMLSSSATTSQVSGIENASGSTAALNTILISDNSVSVNYLTATSGVVYGIYNTGTPTNINIKNNTVSKIFYSGAGLTGTGNIYTIYNTGLAANVYVNNNTIDSIVRINGTTGGATIGVYASSGTNQTIKNNTITNLITNGSAGVTGNIYGIQAAGTTVVVDSNTISGLTNNKTSSTSVMYGIYNLGSPSNENYNYNTISKLTNSGTGAVYGIYVNTATGVRNTSYNTISALLGNGAVDGMRHSTSSPNIFNNKIYDIASNSTTNVVSGLTITSLGSSGTATVYNNFISDIKAPLLNSLTSGVIGINLLVTTANSTINLYYNTIYLNATSTGAAFGSAGIYHTINATATTASLLMRNNIIINKSVANGVGGLTSAFRRSAATSIANYNTNSNTNILYAGTPSATNLIYSDGTNADQTLADFKTRVAPRENYSLTEDVNFVNAIANDLHVVGGVGTLVESNGLAIAGITKDMDGQNRPGPTGSTFGGGAASDIGADEIDAIPQNPFGDISTPMFTLDSIRPLLNTCLTTPHTFYATVTDASGIDSALILWNLGSLGSQTPIMMTSLGGGKYSGSIPSYIDSAISYSFRAVDASVNKNALNIAGDKYKDALYTVNVNASATTVTAGTPINLEVKSPGVAVLGTAITTNSTTSTVGNAYPLWYGGGHQQYLVLASELTTLGLRAGKITSLAFDVATMPTGTITALQGYTISIASSTLTSITAFQTAPAAMPVFGPVNYTPNLGVNTHTFSTPYNWDGTSNIIIDICFNNSISGGSAINYLVKQTAAAFTASVYYQVDNGTGSLCAITTVSGSTPLRPNMQFTGSKGSPVSATWTQSTGGGLSSTNTVATTATPLTAGLYTYSVTASNGLCTASDFVDITVLNPAAPIAAFSLSNDTAFTGGTRTTITLTDKSLNLPSAWKWSFSPKKVTYVGGTDSSSKNPQVQFDAAGFFSIKLVASNITGADSLTKVDSIFSIIQYCASGATSSAGQDIGNVKIYSGIDTILNNGIAFPVLNNSAATGTYSDFTTTLPAFDIQFGKTYNFSIAHISSTSSSTSGRAMYLDLNHDGDFTDPGEKLFTSALYMAAGVNSTGSFTIPRNAPFGLTRMRVVLNNLSSDPAACQTFSNGETEDYLVNIIPAIGDFYPPDFSNITVTPPSGSCTPSSHALSVVITDTTGVDSAWVIWTKANVLQPNIPMTNIGSVYSATIPAVAAGTPVTYSFRARDISVNHNTGNFAGGALVDATFNVEGTASVDSMILGNTVNFTTKVFPVPVIGTGTATSTSYPNPYYSTYWGSKGQYMITAAELSAAGYVAGSFTSLGLSVLGATTTLPFTDFTIKMKNTVVTALTTTFETGLTQVYSNSSYTVLPNQINTHNFQTPFIWDGTSNVVIETCFNNSAWNGSQTISYTPTAYVSCNYFNADNATVCSTPTASNTSSNRPNFLIGQPSTVALSWAALPSATAGLTGASTATPSATPTALGTYTFYVTGNNGSCSYTDTVTVKVKPPVAPIAKFGTNKTIAFANSVVILSDSSLNLPDSVVWSFSPNTVSYVNGTTSKSKNPEVIFTASGLYTVKLVAQNLGGKDSLTKTNYIQVLEAYCVSSATNVADEDIGRVRVGSFIHNSPGATPISSNPLSNKLYSDFLSVVGFQARIAVQDTIEVSIINSSASLYTSTVSAWIDMNRNGVFDNNERILNQTATANLTDRTKVGAFTIPPGAVIGNTVMRVTVWESGTGPCGTYSYGETEDYIINILPPPPGDYYPPHFSSKTITPAGGACTSSPHAISVVVTDTTGVDTVYMHWSINKIQQPNAIMTLGTNNTYSYTIPSAGINTIAYSFSAVDNSINRNRSTYAGGQYADEPLKAKLVSTPDGYIGVGGSYQLGAFISNAVKLGSGTTTTTSTPNPYYTTWFGNKEQYLIRASELLAGGYTAGAITSIGLQVGAVTTTLALTDFTVSIKQSSITALTSTFETGLTPVYSNPAYTVLPNAMNTHTFTSPFIWDGVSSLIIETCFNNSAWNGSQTIEYTTTAFAASLYSTADNATVCSNTTGTTSNNRPNFYIGQPVTVNYAWVNPTNGGLSATNIPNPMATPTGGLGKYAYIVNISDSTCTISDTINVNVVSAPVVNLGGPTGLICGTAPRVLDAGNPGSSYVWKFNNTIVATSRTYSATANGTYKVTVTNQAGLFATDSIVLTTAPALSINLADRTLCSGGTITLDAGAHSSYLWSTGATTQTIQVSAIGSYSVIVMSTAGCTATDTIMVTATTPPAFTLGADQSICDGSALTVDAGNTGATYLWSTGATTQSIAVTAAGSYHVSVTTTSGCILMDTINVTTKPAPTKNLGADVSTCAGTSITLDAGNAGGTYSWNTGATTQTISVTAAGVYFVTVTSANGCSTMDTIIVSLKTSPVVALGADLNICTSDTVTLDAGNTGSTYLWSTGATTRTIKVNMAGTYTVTVTGVNGCVGTDEIVVTNKPIPISTYSITSANGQSVTFLATATAGLQYAWNFGDPTSAANTSQLASPTHVYTAPGLYNVTLSVTNVATGCRATTTTSITVTGLGNDFAEVFKLGAAPNPFAGQTLISYVLPENANNVSAEVYDMIGRKVADIITNESQAAGKYQFDYKNEDLQTASGVYMVRLTVDGKVAYIRIVDIAKK